MFESDSTQAWTGPNHDGQDLAFQLEHQSTASTDESRPAAGG
ncbi:hypothetical protein SynBIOSE41_04005 [Synechococcus sp. BIOS-E4-1]|nr:hypothetical protein SynBIOSE41_04005 [Synechococcus sp. BIOS-E4-1]